MMSFSYVISSPLSPSFHALSLPLLFPSCCLAQHLPPNMTASVVLTNTPLSCFFSLQGSNPPLITSFKLLSHTDTEV